MTWIGSLFFLHIMTHMGGTSQDVKRLKKSSIFTLYTLGFLEYLHFFLALMKISTGFKHLEASHIMSFNG